MALTWASLRASLSSVTKEGSQPMEFLKNYFDKLLLFVSLSGACLLLVHFTHHASDAATISWSQNFAAQILAALLTLMVSRAGSSRGPEITTGDGSNISVAGTGPKVTSPEGDKNGGSTSAVAPPSATASVDVKAGG